MQILKGQLKDLKILDFDSTESSKKFIFSLNNKIVELNTDKNICAKDGDNIIVAGLAESGNTFKAFSLKKIS